MEPGEATISLDPRPRLPATAPPPPPLPSDADWDELTLESFGPRHWNLGCG